jgi:predicted NBD/HSP70 family sugar kinase
LGKNNKSLRLGNKSLVLKNICLNQGVSRIDISKKTGLTKMAVSYIVSELIESGIIKESHTEQVSGAGRNPIILDISEKAPKAAGIYISRDSCSVIVTDLKLKVLFSSSIPFHDENEETLEEKVITLLNRAFKKFGNKIGGIGISTLGPIDCTEGVILNPPNFFGIKNVRIADIVKKQYNVPVIMNNEVNAAALVEKIFGSSSKIDNFIYLALANGIGAGIITGGKLYQNDSSFAGEIGHMSIDYAGETCTCGNKGCIEVYASVPNVEKRLSNTVGKSLPFTELVKLSEDNETVDEILTDVM